MRLVSVVVGLLAFVAVVLAGPASVSAEPPLPAYDGFMSFPVIRGPEDPEEYAWVVELGEEQVLREIDAQHAVVFYSDKHVAFVITAEAAHDAVGSTVPTTLAVSDRNVITLTVHHRAGDPAAGGAPFVYPILGGTGWEGGFQTTRVPMSPPEPVVQSALTPGDSPAPPTQGCTVPRLKGQSLKADRNRLREAGCRLGDVRGARTRTAKVIKQFPVPGTTRAAGAEVAVKLAG